jgi:hypothetical protein
MNATRQAAAHHSRHDRAVGIRAIAALLLAAVTLVPSLARAQDRLERQQTPARQHARFRWTNSCESVPQKTTRIVVVAPVDGPAQAMLPQPQPRIWARVPPAHEPMPAASPLPASFALRAPPALT